MGEHGVFFSDADLRSVGCGRCVLQSSGLCPHNISGSDVFVCSVKDFEGVDFSFCDRSEVVGFCPDLVSFVFSFWSEGDSVSAVWEKFFLYVARLQAMDDYSDFVRLRKKINRLKSEGVFGEELKRLELEESNLKLWWSRLNDSVIKGLGRVVDRERKSLDKDKDRDLVKKLSVQEFSKLMKEKAKLIEGEIVEK